MVFLNSLNDLKALKEIQDFCLRIELIDRWVFFFIFDIFVTEVMEQVHPGGLSVKVGYDGAPAGFEDALCLLNGATRTACCMQYTICPDRIKSAVQKRQIQCIGRTDVFRLDF